MTYFELDSWCESQLTSYHHVLQNRNKYCLDRLKLGKPLNTRLVTKGDCLGRERNMQYREIVVQVSQYCLDNQ